MDHRTLIEIIRRNRVFREPKLNLRHQNITELPPEIGDLTHLTWLSLADNHLRSLPPEIGGLRKLYWLDVGRNRLASLPGEIGRMRSLAKLYLDYNRLRHLPSEFINLRDLLVLFLEGNPLPIPPEILSLYEEPAVVIDTYFQRAALTMAPLREARIHVVGDAGVGKTALIRRILGEGFDSTPAPTKGIEIRHATLRIGQKPLKLHFWEYGAGEAHLSVYERFFAAGGLYLLVLDGAGHDLYDRVRFWQNTIRCFVKPNRSPMIIVLNRHDVEPTDLEKKRREREFTSAGEVLHTSCLTSVGIRALMSRIDRMLGDLEFFGESTPKTWHTVKNRLESIKAPFIPYRRFAELCRESGIPGEEEERRLLNVIRGLGVGVLIPPNYPPEESYLFQPEWFFENYFALLTRGRQSKTPGIIDEDSLAEICSGTGLDSETRLFFMNQLRKAGLCTDLPGYLDKRFLIPELLGKARPEPPVGPPEDSHVFQLKYKTLPAGLPARFLIQMRDRLDLRYCNPHRCVLRGLDGATQARIRFSPQTNSVDVHLFGPPEGRKTLLAAIRKGFAVIHAEIPYVTMRESIPFPGAEKTPRRRNDRHTDAAGGT